MPRGRPAAHGRSSRACMAACTSEDTPTTTRPCSTCSSRSVASSSPLELQVNVSAPSLRLYCLPYAGSSASVYVRWKRRLPAWIEVVPVELPGRGRRIGEPLQTTVAGVLDRIASDVRPEPGQPFALFGHSLGAILAFELAHRLEQRAGLF